MTRLFQMLAGLLIAATLFATLGPPRYRPHLGLGQDGEHALAFALIGLALGFAFPRRPWRTALIAVVLTGALELAQFLAPGRHARWQDFFVDALAVCAGLAIATAAHRLVRSRRQGTKSAI